VLLKKLFEFDRLSFNAFAVKNEKMKKPKKEQ